MSKLKLVIGDKNLSSWSLRPWFAMRQAGIPFEEDLILLDRPETKAEILKRSPSGRVPCLIDGDLAIWDSLAILEYVSEKFPDRGLWPADARMRAVARSVSAEMHSGFASLRKEWPMKFAVEGLRKPMSAEVSTDVARIAEIWDGCRRDFGAGGPFLFGRFTIADAMFAPVASRFATYGPVELPARAADWRDEIWSLAAIKEWGEGAKAEIG